jgi:hypothetical protein
MLARIIQRLPLRPSWVKVRVQVKRADFPHEEASGFGPNGLPGMRQYRVARLAREPQQPPVRQSRNLIVNNLE